MTDQDYTSIRERIDDTLAQLPRHIIFGLLMAFIIWQLLLREDAQSIHGEEVMESEEGQTKYKQS